MIRKTISFAASTLAIGYALTGCGGSGTEPLKQGFSGHIFISTQYDKKIQCFDDMLGTHRYSVNIPDNVSTQSCALDEQNRLLVSCSDGTIRRFASSGAPMESFGSSGSGVGQFQIPTKITFDKLGRIYIADWCNQRLVRMDDFNGTGWKVLDLSPYSSETSDQTENVALDSQGRIYVAGHVSGKILRFNNMDDMAPAAFGSSGTGFGKFGGITSLAIDPSDRILVCDKLGNVIMRFDDMTGKNWVTLGTIGPGANQFNRPSNVTTDPAGNIYVTDVSNHRVVQMKDMTGAGWTTFGDGAMFPWMNDILVR